MELSYCYYQMPKAFLSMVDLTGDLFQSAEPVTHTSSGTPLSAVSGYDIYLPCLYLDMPAACPGIGVLHQPCLHYTATGKKLLLHLKWRVWVHEKHHSGLRDEIK